MKRSPEIHQTSKLSDLKKTRSTGTLPPIFGTVTNIRRRKSMEIQDRQSKRSTNDSVTVAKPRKYLTTPEVEKLITAASSNRHAHRDQTALLLAYRHACDPANLFLCAGTILILPLGESTCDARRAVCQPCIQSAQGSFELCASCDVSRKARPTCFSTSANRPGMLPVINGWSLGRPRKLNFHSLCRRMRFDIRVALN